MLTQPLGGDCNISSCQETSECPPSYPASYPLVPPIGISLLLLPWRCNRLGGLNKWHLFSYSPDVKVCLIPVRTPFLVYRQPPSLWVSTSFDWGWIFCSISLLKETLILSDQGPTLMISFNCNYFLTSPVFNYSHIGDLGLQQWACGKGQISSMTSFYSLRCPPIYDHSLFCCLPASAPALAFLVTPPPIELSFQRDNR